MYTCKNKEREKWYDKSNILIIWYKKRDRNKIKYLLSLWKIGTLKYHPYIHATKENHCYINLVQQHDNW